MLLESIEEEEEEQLERRRRGGEDDEDQNLEDDNNNEDAVEISQEESYKAFIEAFKKCRDDETSNVILAIGALPSINHVLGRGHTYTRLLKFCIANGILSKEKYDKKTAYTKLGRADLTEFHTSAISASANDGTFGSMCRAVLDPFEAELIKLAPKKGEAAATNNANSVANRIALLAWLVVSDSACPIWEELQKEISPHVKPQLLDQMDGVNGWKSRKYDELCSIAEAIKGGPEIDFKLFEASHIGTEAALAMASFNPGLAVLESPWLRANCTAMINLHDQLIANLDCSGSGTPAGTIERRIKCFNQFLGPEGKVKNLNLFYCFVVWEDAVQNRGKDIRWLSRTLQTGRSSAEKIDITKSSSDISLSKKDKKTIFMMKQMMSPTFSSSPAILPAVKQEIQDDEYLKEKSILAKRKAEYYEQKTKTKSTFQCNRVMESAAFQHFSQEEQNQIKQKILANLLS